MGTVALPRLTSNRREIDTDPGKFGWLRDSNSLLGNPEALRRQMAEDGYLFLPGFFERESIVRVRRAICGVLADEGLLDPVEPVEKAIARPGIEMYFRADIANGEPAGALLREVIYGPKIMAFFSEFLGSEAMHYDYTWMRAIAPGVGTYPHCDVVYMGRGTKDLYTAWVPLGDVPLETGGLILKEGSHRDDAIRSGYCTLDVDTACQNRPGESELNAAGFPGFGALADSLVDVREDAGGRWLTCPEYRMGDLLIFSVFTVHGSLDNHSREIRMSSDSRYQRANEPVDERWVGETPPAHGGSVVKNMIC